MLCRQPLTPIVLVAGILLAALGGQPALAQSSLHLALTPSQKPTDLMVAGEAFGAALGKLVGVPIRVTGSSRPFGTGPRISPSSIRRATCSRTARRRR